MTKEHITTDLYGLVLAGGQSTRMGRDKSLLKYRGREQSAICHDLLKRYCNKVFLSNRKEQSEILGHKEFLQINDSSEFTEIGPLGGMLSAMKRFPHQSWLIIGCDLPFLNHETLGQLVASRDSCCMATAFLSAKDGLPEPLCSIYENHSYPILLKCLKAGIKCPRKILNINSISVRFLRLKDENVLNNVNTKDEFDSAIKSLKI